jgi:hypothetical protein
MDEFTRRVDVVDKVFRERVSTELGLERVAYPEHKVCGNDVVFSFFSTTDRGILSPSVRLSAEELGRRDDDALRVLARRKLREWVKEYASEGCRVEAGRRRGAHSDAGRDDRRASRW